MEPVLGPAKPDPRDPKIGRFLSADTIIHDVTYSGDLNRYSYVHNNPLSYVDANGHGFFKKLFGFLWKAIKIVLAIVVAVVVAYYLGPLAVQAFGSLLGGAITTGVAAGAASVVVTGRPKAFLTGFASGFAGYLGGAVGAGLVGGALAEAHGGRFGQGFLVAGVSSLANAVPGDSWQAAAARIALAGGTSVLGGGKFADGAVTAAFVYLVRQGVPRLAHQIRVHRNSVEHQAVGTLDNDPGDPVWATKDMFNEDELERHRAAFDRLNNENPSSVSDNLEHGGYGYKTANGLYGTTDAAIGQADRVDISTQQNLVPKGASIIFRYHTHGGPFGDFNDFSGKDILNARNSYQYSYLSTATGRLLYYDYVKNKEYDLTDVYGRVKH